MKKNKGSGLKKKKIEKIINSDISTFRKNIKTFPGCYTLF